MIERSNALITHSREVAVESGINRGGKYVSHGTFLENLSPKRLREKTEYTMLRWNVGRGFLLQIVKSKLYPIIMGGVGEYARTDFRKNLGSMESCFERLRVVYPHIGDNLESNGDGENDPRLRGRLLGMVNLTYSREGFGEYVFDDESADRYDFAML